VPLRPKALIVFTDLDGCLLDSETYAHDAAQTALASLAAEGHTLVPCSAKTRSEMGLVARELQLADPFIVENGGAIVFRRSPIPKTSRGLDDRVSSAFSRWARHGRCSYQC
jgi:predicted mannosyl-3-phosphoglycerate phosphatase (HAD superfamily)